MEPVYLGQWPMLLNFSGNEKWGAERQSSVVTVLDGVS